MARSLEDIEAMLEALPGQTFRFDKIKEDALTYTGALRTPSGRNVVEPSPESASMIIALRPSIDFIVASPEIVADLVAQVRSLSLTKEKGAPAPPRTEKAPDRPEMG